MLYTYTELFFPTLFVIYLTIKYTFVFNSVKYLNLATKVLTTLLTYIVVMLIYTPKK